MPSRWWPGERPDAAVGGGLPDTCRKVLFRDQIGFSAPTGPNRLRTQEPRGATLRHWWARGDLNPHILSDTGT
jgi:hypothetical protein